METEQLFLIKPTQANFKKFWFISKNKEEPRLADRFEEFGSELEQPLAIARDKFPGSSVSLDALCKRYRIDNSKRTQHTALIDCDLLGKVYINLIDQKEPTLNFQNLENQLPEFFKISQKF